MRKYIIILIILSGCGKRITSIEKTDIKTDSLHIEKVVILNQELKLLDIGRVTPFDNSKPMIIDGKYYYNVSIDFDKSIISKSENKTNESLSYTGSEISGKKKEIKKKDYSNIYIGIVFILALFLFIYLKLKL